MGLFKKNHKMETITCGEGDYLVWKWRPGRKSKIKGGIPVGTKIQVAEGAVAVFVYKNEIGTYLDFIAGPRDEALTAENLPIIANLMGPEFTEKATFPAEVYFINLMKTMSSSFDVPSFEVHDPSAPDIGVPVTVKGVLTYRIVDAAEFVKRHRLDEITEDGLTNQVIEAAGKYIKSAIMNAPSVDNLPVVEFERRISEINDLVEIPIRERLAEDLGVKVTSVDIETIDIDEGSEGYKKLMGEAAKNSDQNSEQPTVETSAENPTETPVQIPPETSTEPSTNTPTAQPPAEETKYYVAVKGKSVGPYRVNIIKQLVSGGTITAETLVWKTGMSGWTKIADIPELN